MHKSRAKNQFSTTIQPYVIATYNLTLQYKVFLEMFFSNRAFKQIKNR